MGRYNSKFKFGQIAECLSKKVGNKVRPCAIIGETDTHYIVLPITNTKTGSGKLLVGVNLITCCKVITGYFLLYPEKILKNKCFKKYGAGECEISNFLYFFLIINDFFRK